MILTFDPNFQPDIQEEDSDLFAVPFEWTNTLRNPTKGSYRSFKSFNHHKATIDGFSKGNDSSDN